MCKIIDNKNYEVDNKIDSIKINSDEEYTKVIE